MDKLGNLFALKQHKRNLTKLHQVLKRGTFYHESRVEEYPVPAHSGLTIEYDELRESVKSLWRKQSPSDPPLKIVAFVIPRGDLAPSDYFILSHNNYQPILDNLCLYESRVVFYELEYSHTPGGTLSSVFNEYVVMPKDISEGMVAPRGSCRSSISKTEADCKIKLNSIVFV
ncbi:hypothetical protein FB645_003049 [Coemansia sp. IMI 203386]|nr:hypothetical protein FB645_003049 [Coemansia sp. IMI 203386]